MSVQHVYSLVSPQCKLSSNCADRQHIGGDLLEKKQNLDTFFFFFSSFVIVLATAYISTHGSEITGDISGCSGLYVRMTRVENGIGWLGFLRGRLICFRCADGRSHSNPIDVARYKVVPEHILQEKLRVESLINSTQVDWCLDGQRCSLASKGASIKMKAFLLRKQVGLPQILSFCFSQLQEWP